MGTGITKGVAKFLAMSFLIGHPLTWIFGLSAFLGRRRKRKPKVKPVTPKREGRKPRGRKRSGRFG
ncbi:MAG: hypothetical protein E3J64_00570 [Anaerolineales bacterium]|nr:MAG: hypothetical protein E3J64_00570 [Anaerolineales bacterium]